jgi:hypothetical protein
MRNPEEDRQAQGRRSKVKKQIEDRMAADNELRTTKPRLREERGAVVSGLLRSTFGVKCWRPDRLA